MSNPKKARQRNQYGLLWDLEKPIVEIELDMFLNQEKYAKDFPTLKLMGAAYHFKQVVNWYWGPTHRRYFAWHSWNEKMLDALIKHKWCWFSGCAGSQKTTMLALWGIVNWLAHPTKTCVLMTSTSLKESRQRIWGEVEDLFVHAGVWKQSSDDEQRTLPGKLVSSQGKIVTINDGQPMSDRCGIHLIAGEKSREKENIGKIIGIHNERIFFLGDEMPELSPALIEAAKGNLQVNPFFQMAGSGNFKSIYDTFGIEAKPKNGWGSVSVESEEWECENGICLHFDGLKSPNVLLGYDKYPGLYGRKHLEDHRKMGENTVQFWRMCRSFICQGANADRVYFEADLLKGKVDTRVKWLTQPTKVAAMDPAWATGGDRAIAIYGLLGMSTDNLMTLQIEELTQIQEDVRIMDKNRSYQVAVGFRGFCEQRGIEPENTAFDGSGGGLPFGALLTELWSNRCLSVQFGGAASERIASVKDRRPASQVYCNRVTELWFAGVDFVLSNQIKGMPNSLARELQERRYDTTKGVSGLRLKVERKDEMKDRTNGVSPDEADAFVILIELCRERLGFNPVGIEARRQKEESSWVKMARDVHAVQGEGAYEQETVEEYQEA